jgi:hypothetical protein
MTAKIKSIPKPKTRSNGSQFEIMIDTGGTFTDGVLIDNRGRIDVAKAETDPGDPANGIMNCRFGICCEIPQACQSAQRCRRTAF